MPTIWCTPRGLVDGVVDAGTTSREARASSSSLRARGRRHDHFRPSTTFAFFGGVGAPSADRSAGTWPLLVVPSGFILRVRVDDTAAICCATGICVSSSLSVCQTPVLQKGQARSFTLNALFRKTTPQAHFLGGGQGRALGNQLGTARQHGKRLIPDPLNTFGLTRDHLGQSIALWCGTDVQYAFAFHGLHYVAFIFLSPLCGGALLGFVNKMPPLRTKNFAFPRRKSLWGVPPWCKWASVKKTCPDLVISASSIMVICSGSIRKCQSF